MSALDQILSKTNFTHDIDGVEFVLRTISAEVSLGIIGTKTLGIIRGSQSKGEMSQEDTIAVLREMMPKYLKAAMVNPRLGDATNIETDTISMDDLGPFAMKVFSVVFERSGYGKLENFPNSSEVTADEN